MKRILIADGDVDSRSVYGMMLRHSGYAVAEAADGEAALRLLESAEYDAVVCELTLKRVDGYRLLEAVRADERLRELCVVVLTALALPGERERAERAGCTLFLVKPLEPRALVEAVGKVLGGARAGGG